MKTVILNDGEDLRVFIRTEPSVSDSAQEVEAVCQIYRVVLGYPSDEYPLTLVPLGRKPVILHNLPTNWLEDAKKA